MKSVILTLSVLANAAALAWLAWPRDAASDPMTAQRSVGRGADVAQWREDRDARRKAATEAGQPAVDWDYLKSLEPAAMVAALQEAGLPPSLVRAILQLTLGERYTARRLELLAAVPVKPWWKANYFESQTITDPVAQAELQKISRDNAKTIADLLGPDTGSLYSNYERMAQGSLPLAKVEQMKQVTADYQELGAIVRAEMQGVTLPEDREKLRLLSQEQASDIKALFTPEEYEEYLLRNSPAAATVRSSLALMSPTEAEFQKVYALQQAFDARFNTVPTGLGLYMTSDPARAAERMEAQKVLAAQIKEALGPVRGEEYERLSDYNYRTAAQYIAGQQLPMENATRLWRLQKDFGERALAVQKDTSLDFETRKARLTVLRDEANGKVTEVLGAGTEKYKSAAGYWIDGMIPVPPPTKGL